MWIDTISTAQLSRVITVGTGQSMICGMWAAFITAGSTDNKGADKLDKIWFKAFKTLTTTHYPTLAKTMLYEILPRMSNTFLLWVHSQMIPCTKSQSPILCQHTNCSPL